MCKQENLSHDQSAATLPRYDSLYIGDEWGTSLDGGMMDSIDSATGKLRVNVARGGNFIEPTVFVNANKTGDCGAFTLAMIAKISLTCSVQLQERNL